MSNTPASIVRNARERSALSQRALAQRANTSQSVVARIELGETSPTWETLTRLVEGAGFDLELCITPRPETGSNVLAEVARIRSLSPDACLQEVAKSSRRPPVSHRE